MSDTSLRPVLALLEALDDLDAHRDDVRWSGRGTARRRAFNARHALPSGALDAPTAALLAQRWRRHFEPDFPAPAPTGAPPPSTATTYFVSSHDAHGAVLRARLECLPPRHAPWQTPWPCPTDDDADAAAEDAMRAAAALLRFTPTEPMRGWHRVVPADADARAWEGLAIEGRSLAAPLALMLLSLWTDHPLDARIAVTGDLDADLRLVLPGDARSAVAAKVAAVQRERACIRTVIVPVGCTPREPSGVEIVEAADLRAVAARFGLPLQRAGARPTSVQGWLRAVDEAEWLVRARAIDPPVMRARLEQLDAASVSLGSSAAPRALDAARLRLLGRLCGYHAHAFAPERALDAHRRIDELVARASAEGRPLPRATFAIVRNVQASLMIDRGRFASARRYAAEALDAARAACDGAEAARVASTLGRIEAHARDDARALALLDAALDELRANIPWETNLCECYRIGTLARLARWDDALDALARARAANAAEDVATGWRADNALYLDYEELKLALRRHDARAAAAAYERCDAQLDARRMGPWPAAGVAVRGVEAALLAGDRNAAAARFEHLVRIAREHPSARREVGRAAALLAIDRATHGEPVDAALATHVDRYVASLDDAEPGSLGAARDAVVDAGSSATTLAALLAVEIR